MKKLIKKTIITLSLLVIGVGIGKATTSVNVEAQNEQKTVTIKQIVTESNDDWNLNEGSYAVEFTDGSWALIDEKNQKYVFQPVSMGDWDYELENIQQLHKCIQNYLVINN